MITVGRRIYYDVLSGEVILDLGERIGSEPPSTIERDIEVYKILSERNRDTFDLIELEYGQYKQDFIECSGYRVNPNTVKLEFSYPDPSQPAAPPVYQTPLSIEVANIKESIAELAVLMATLTN